MSSTESPYVVFRSWLFDNNTNSEIDEYTVKIINVFVVLCMFGNLVKLKDVSIYIEEKFNNLDLSTYDKLDFFKYLKQIVINNKITKSDLAYISIKKVDTSVESKLTEIYPFIKQEDHKLVLEILEKENKNIFNQLTKKEKIKITKRKNTKK